MATSNWAPHGAEIHRRIMPFLPTSELEQFLKRNAIRHFLVMARLLVMTSACAFLSLKFSNPVIWIPASLLQGFNILGFITLLHDALHLAIFEKTMLKGHYIAGFFYALPSAISPSQFTRWHLDHHAQLGTDDKDPKRAYLTPKKVKRLNKLRYITPLLFLIYAKASALAGKDYPLDLKKKIGIEKAIAYVFHTALLISIVSTAGFYPLFRVYLFPLFFCFPIAFTINRLGQHYNIDPGDPAKWATLINGGTIINFLHLNSNFHLEHHYFPRVPLYRLPELNRKLQPFYEKIGHRPETYTRLLWGWFVLNKEPHTDWDAD